MKKYFNKTLFTTIFVALMGNSYGQFTISGEIRPRAEYRHGFKSLAYTNSTSAFFIDQRTRINLAYSTEKYKTKLVLQDVRVWGSQPQLVSNDGSLTTLHEAWAELNMGCNISAKLGRQEIIYDDHRIFGNVGWAQQARSHDALLFKYAKEGLKIESGFAFNQDKPQLNTTFYSVKKSYKAFQYLWANKKLTNVNFSFLFLNLGVQGGTINDHKTYYNQTLGARVAYKKNKMSASGAIYSQFGDYKDGVKSISSLLYMIDTKYAVHDKHTLGVGLEHLSGNDQSNPSNDMKAFNPYFGTNHKFNGLMDYFYVGNHINNVGLNDIYFTYIVKPAEKIILKAFFHIFSSDGKILDRTSTAMKKSLGTELDIVGNYKVSKEVSVTLGYSRMFATETMEVLKKGDKDENNQWAWMMVTFKPTFFTTKEKIKN